MLIRMEFAQVVGQNISRLRKAAGLTLAELAAAGEISKTTLHGIEQGAGNPTLSTLWALAAALRVPLGELLDSPAREVEVVRAADGPYVHGDAVHARLLHRIKVSGTVEVYEMDVDEESQQSAAHLSGVQECIVVTRGKLATGPIDQPVDLAAGDSVRFSADAAHFYRGLSKRNRAVLLMVHPD
jgi:transcriptional regulator with XRE-family HTH domain